MIRRRIAGAAFVIMLGTLTTSVFGFVRAFVIARYFGASLSTDAFFAALVVPQMFYDQIIGGAVTAALIPTFSRLAGQDERALWRVVGSVMALIGIALVVLVLLLEAAAPLVMRGIASGFALHSHHPGTLPLAVKMLRIVLPTLLFLGLSAVAVAALYSLGRRAVSAFAPSCYHLGIIASAAVASRALGAVALSIGAVGGAALQFGVQVPALMRAQRHSATQPWLAQLRIDLNDPAIRHMLRLYAPVAAGMCVSIAGQVADVNFKSHLPQEGGLTAMQYATQIVQFPVGIVVAALGLAILPAISADAAQDRFQDFKETLALGFRVVMLLMVPAAVGLMTLSTPIVALLFERGHFHHVDTIHTATALLGYGPQLPLVGIDQLLIFAFYARHNTLTPALVGVLGVAVYVAVAAIVLGPLTIFGLALANTIQIGVHALVLLALLLRATGPLPGRKLASTTAKVCLATTAMAGAIVGVERALPPASHLVAAGGPIIVAIAVYGALIVLLRVEEADLAWRAFQARFVGHGPF